MYEGIPELLKNLKSAGKTLIVATSKPTVFAEKILEHFGLSEYFSLTVGSELDGTRSKKDEVIAHALKKAGIKSTAECVMIGDREHDVFGALKNNIDSIGVLYGYGSRAELMSAGAVYIAASVREIEKIVICRRTLSLTSKIKDFKAECCT